MDGIGSEIWKLLESPRPVSEICDIVRERYRVQRKRCEEDGLAYLEDPASDNTIKVVVTAALVFQPARADRACSRSLLLQRTQGTFALLARMK